MALPDIDGVTCCPGDKTVFPETAVIILSMHNIDVYVRKALQAGALAYVLKDSSSTELLTAIREALAGRKYLSPAIAQKAYDFFIEGGIQTPLGSQSALSKRERETLTYIADGMTAHR
jgi:DNA-binding NarL/FixJ family response regulator